MPSLRAQRHRGRGSAAGAWRPYDVGALTSLEVAAAALSGAGLPVDAAGLFVRDARRELTPRDLPGCGPALFLGRHERGANTYWLARSDGAVWVLRGERPERINASVPELQEILSVWQEFVASGLDEDHDLYDDILAATLTRARRSDLSPWWSTLFDDVESGLVTPQSPGW